MFCQNCGNQLNEGAAFCPKCGTKTGAASGFRVQGTNENSVNQQSMEGQPVNIQQSNQAYYAAQNPNSQGQAQYNKPNEKRYIYIVIVIAIAMIVIGLPIFLFSPIGFSSIYFGIMLLVIGILTAAIVYKMLLILFGVIVVSAGGGLIIHGNSLNDSITSQVESIFSSGTTNPGNSWIIAGAVVLLIGLLLTIAGIVNKAKSKQ